VDFTPAPLVTSLDVEDFGYFLVYICLGSFEATLEPPHPLKISGALHALTHPRQIAHDCIDQRMCLLGARR
jgi:hypothetical protein